MSDPTLYTYKDSAGQTYSYGDPSINADAIKARGLTFVSGPANPNSTVSQDPLAARYGVPPPTTTGSPAPSTMPGAVPSPLSPLDQAQADYYANTPKNVDPAAIRETVRKQMQGTIDSTNALYDNLRTTQLQENDKQNARVRGVNVNSGLMGSDFASANAQGAQAQGDAALAALERERSAKVEEVLGNIDARAVAEIASETKDAQQNQKDYIDYLKTKQEGARTDIGTLAKSGVTLDSMPADQYQKLLKQSGYDEFTFKMIYNNARAAASKIDYQWKTVGNQLIGYGIDPLTNQVSTVTKDLPGNVPANYKPQVLDNGTIVFYPDVMDPKKPVKDQIITYDTGVRKDTRTAGEKDDASAAARLAPVTTAMSALRDPQSGYVDPSAYADMYQTYIEQHPGKGKEFIDNNPVSVYIDPAERYKFSTTGN